MFQITTALRKLKKLKKRIRGIAGGTSASKTISILQVLIDQCQTDQSPRLTSVTSESMPHLKRGAMRDFKNIMMDHEYWDDRRWNATNFTYTFESGTLLEFFSLDVPRKVRGPRRKRLFINEANSISLETFEQLEVRTEDTIWLDWNPVSEFWFYTDVLPKRSDVDFLTLTYKDNEGLPESIVKTIETRKGNTNWWRVFGEGQLGEFEGRIFTNWQVLDNVPDSARLERYGLDFGYSNNPTAVDAIYRWNGGFVIDEVLHQKGLQNKEIADVFLSQPKALVIADSAEPKSIDEIRSYGVNILPTTKGPGSVLQRIQYVQQQKIWVTKRSVNTIKEQRNWLWSSDKDGRMINVPSPYWNHHMDDIGYAITSLRPNDDDPMGIPDDSQWVNRL